MPVGSIVTVRTGGANDLEVVSVDEAGETPAAIAVADAGTPAASGEGQPVERQVELGKGVDVVVRKGDREVMAWRFAVEPDHAPEIAFLKPPAPARSGALALTYSLKDDYGVVAGSAEITPLDEAAAAPRRGRCSRRRRSRCRCRSSAPATARRRRSATSPPTRGPAPG